jgi:hypothetical protein
VAARPSLPPELGLGLVRKDTDRARSLGAAAPIVVAAGAGAPGDNVGGRMQVPRDQCALLLARGSPSIDDLDLFVYGDDGVAIAEDETPTATPGLMLCPPHSDYLYAFGRVAAGHGLFAVSVQTVNPRDATAVAGALGVGEARTADATEAEFAGLDEAVSRRRKALGAAAREQRRVAVPLDPRIPARVGASIRAHGCVDLLVVPTEDVADIDLAVFDETGRILGRGSTDDVEPAALVCSDIPAEVVFELRPHAGRGLAAAVTTSVPEPQAGESPGVPVVRYPGPAGSLDEARRTLDARLAKSGYAGATFSSEGTAGMGKRASTGITLSGDCSRIDVVGATAGGLDAWLWSPQGALLSHDEGGGHLVLVGCSGRAARLDVEGLGESGAFFVVARPLVRTSKHFVAHPLAASRLLQRLLALDDADAGSGIGLPATGNVPVEVRSLTPNALSVEGGQIAEGTCVDVAVGLGTGAEGVELRIVATDGDEELAFARGTFSTVATACAPAGSRALQCRIEARVVAGATDALLVSRPRARSGAADPPRATAKGP